MSVIWLKLWHHVWQSVKPLVKDFGSSPTEFTMEVLEEMNLSTPDASIPWRTCAHWDKRFGGLKNAVLSQRIGYSSAGCRTSIRADCALQILPSSEPGCEGEKALY